MREIRHNQEVIPSYLVVTVRERSYSTGNSTLNEILPFLLNEHSFQANTLHIRSSIPRMIMAITDRKMIALYIALLTLLWSAIAGGAQGKSPVILVLMIIIWPLLLIWFSEAASQEGGRFRASPPIIAEIAGWIFLLIVAIGTIVLTLKG